MARRKGKVFTLFESGYRISFFHKPSMGLDDTFYYIILDDAIRIRLKLFNNTVLVIDEIQSLQKSYMSSYYDNFITFLMKQTLFTILISKLGNTSCIDDSCVKENIPIIEDERFITYPSTLYSRICTYLNNDKERYGFYLLAVAGDDNSDNINTNGELSISEQFKKFIITNFPKSSTQPNVIRTDDIDFNIGGITITCHITNSVDIINVDSPKEISNVTLMSIFERLENFLDVSPIIIKQVFNKRVYDICKLREYDRIYAETGRSSGLGSYYMKRFD